MLDKINKLREEIGTATLNGAEELEAFRLKYLSKKGLINNLFDEFRTLPGEMKRDIGKPLNELKQFIQQTFDDNK